MDCNGSDEGDGNKYEGGGQATATATKRVMVAAMATMVVGNKEGNGDSDKSNGNSNKGGWQATATRAMATSKPGKQW